MNNKSLSRFNSFDLRKMKEVDLSFDNLKALIESLLQNSSESLQLRTTYSIESGLRELLTDWYNIDYAVEMDNDKIQDMSPGKKPLFCFAS